MPKWLQGNVVPTLLLWLYAIACGVALGVGTSSPFSALYQYFVFLPLLAAWISADAEKRRYELSYEYDSLISMLWPLPLLTYLFQTRGWRAWLTLFWFSAMWIVTIIVWFLTTRLCDYLAT